MGDKNKSAAPDRLEEFETRLRQAQGSKEKKKQNTHNKGSAVGLAFRIATDLVCAIAVGVGIGWGLDHWLDTKPVFLLIFFFLGAAAGVMNVIRVANKTADAAKIKDADKLPVIDDDDD